MQLDDFQPTLIPHMHFPLRCAEVPKVDIDGIRTTTSDNKNFSPHSNEPSADP